MGDPIARFQAKYTVDESGCWLWQAGGVPQGYGVFYWAGRQGYAHRFSHETFIGPIPDGYQVDHLCRVRNCVNPEHLEAVTARENLLRGATTTALNAAKTRCDNGHEYTEENTYRYANGNRRCRACGAEQARERRRRKVA